MSKDIQISIVIPTCNRARSLARCLRSIAKQRGPAPFEVIVVDDGSFDHTPSVVGNLESEVPFPLRYLTQPNRGPASARNLGVASAAGSTIVFLDDDHQVCKGWLEALCKPLTDPGIGIVNGLNLSVPGGGIASRYLCYTDQRGAAKMAADKVLYLTSGNASMRKETFLEAGGFSHRFRSTFKYVAPGAEDTELGLRIRRSGRKILYRPEALTNHYRETSTARLIKERFNFGRNRVRWLQAEGTPLRLGSVTGRTLRLLASWAWLPLTAARETTGAGFIDRIVFAVLDKASLTSYQVGTLCGLLADDS